MPERKSEAVAVTPWHVPVMVEDIPEDGQHVDLVADAALRATVSRVAGLRDLPRLEAHFDLARRGADGVHVAGTVSATVGQNCVVTLEPLANEVAETVDLVFAPRPPLKEDDKPIAGRHEAQLDAPEPLLGGVLDLGAIATEFLILGLDPYPRKAGAVFQPPPVQAPEEGPFAALAKLAKH